MSLGALVHQLIPFEKGCPLPVITAIAHDVPSHDIHAAFAGWAEGQLATRERAVFDRMAARSAIAHRWSVLPKGRSPVDVGGFYDSGRMPPTSARMDLYARAAPDLALAAIGKLGPLGNITHVVVASCTGFTAPGIDQILCERLGLRGSTERLMIGFMGCYAGVTALKAARTIVRSEPSARVLVVAVELSTLHLQSTTELEPLLAMLQFADGAAAALVEAAGAGFELDRPFAATLPETRDLIRWGIGDTGFAMHLSGEVPRRIGDALADAATATRLTGGIDIAQIDGWAVHAGGRSILDAVERGLGLPSEALAASRTVLHDFGNMSSATLLFALGRLWDARPNHGVALAFGPGLAAEGLTFGWTDAD